MDFGVTVYATFRDGRLHIEREFTVIGDELRMEFVKIRDEKHAWSPTSAIPSHMRVARRCARSEGRMYDDQVRVVSTTLDEFLPLLHIGQLTRWQAHGLRIGRLPVTGSLSIQGVGPRSQRQRLDP